MKIIQKIIGKIVNILIVLVIIAIIICEYSVFSIKVLHKGYVNFFGYSVFEVATGSMKDEINIGDAVLVKINDDYEVGDIITYQSGEEFITHRVVSKTDTYIITKGDANNVNDNPIDKGLVLGRVVKIMPQVGIWKKVILTPKVIILILITLFVFSILFSYDGNAIKIVSFKKAQKEIDQKIEDEVNKKVAVISRRKKRVKKVLDATQILDLNEVKKIKENDKKKKTLDATQIIDISDIKRK
jgi:signal peptidase